MDDQQRIAFRYKRSFSAVIWLFCILPLMAWGFLRPSDDWSDKALLVLLVLIAIKDTIKPCFIYPTGYLCIDDQGVSFHHKFSIFNEHYKWKDYTKAYWGESRFSSTFWLSKEVGRDADFEVERWLSERGSIVDEVSKYIKVERKEGCPLYWRSFKVSDTPESPELGKAAIHSTIGIFGLWVASATMFAFTNEWRGVGGTQYFSQILLLSLIVAGAFVAYMVYRKTPAIGVFILAVLIYFSSWFFVGMSLRVVDLATGEVSSHTFELVSDDIGQKWVDVDNTQISILLRSEGETSYLYSNKGSQVILPISTGWNSGVYVFEKDINDKLYALSTE